MNRILIVVLAIGAVLVAGVAGAIAAGNGSTTSEYTIGSGTEVASNVFSIEDRQLLDQLGATGTITRVGSLRGTAFYTVNTADGGRCYGFGSTSTGGLSLGCSTVSELQEPISDMSVVVLDPTDPDHRAELREFQGIAADGVASVAIVARDGTLYSTPVVSNVYRMASSDVPHIQPSAFVALDATGKRLSTESFSGS